MKDKLVIDGNDFFNNYILKLEQATSSLKALKLSVATDYTQGKLVDEDIMNICETTIQLIEPIKDLFYNYKDPEENVMTDI